MEEKEAAPQDKEKQCNTTNTCSSMGIVFALLSAIAYTVNTVCVASIPLPVTSLMILRAMVQVLVLAPFTINSVQSETIQVLFRSRNVSVSMILANLIGSSTTLLFYTSLKMISLGDAVSICNLSVVMSGVFARVCLKETYTMFDGAFALVALVGSVFIARPSFIFAPIEETEDNPLRVAGLAVAFLVAVFMALFSILLRKLGSTDKVPPLVSLFYFSSCILVVGSLGTIVTGGFSYPCQQNLLPLLLFSLSGLFGQLFMIMAFSREKPGTVSVVMTSEIVMTLLFQVSYQ